VIQQERTGNESVSGVGELADDLTSIVDANGRAVEFISQGFEFLDHAAVIDRSVKTAIGRGGTPDDLPPILPHDATLFAVLRTAHTWLAFALFATFLAHLGAALTHALVFRDGVFASMASWRARTE